MIGKPVTILASGNCTCSSFSESEKEHPTKTSEAFQMWPDKEYIHKKK